MSLEDIAVHAGHKVLMVDELYFTDCLSSTGDFRPAAQASPNALMNYPNQSQKWNHMITMNEQMFLA